MVGSSVATTTTDRSKEAIGMMALHEALRTVCLNSDWTYSVFWTIRPRPRVRGGSDCKVGDDNGSLMLMWEDGFCRDRVAECLDEGPVKRAFSKMSIQLYNYGEGLMGKVASDKCHKWVFKEPIECETKHISSQWQSSFDAQPPEWTDQFESGIQTIAVIQAGNGLLQLGSSKIIPEDLHFVLRMRHIFESLGYQSGFYLFSSASVSSAVPLKQPVHPPFDWARRPIIPSPSPILASPNFQTSASFEIPSPGMGNMTEDEENGTKWPNGLTFFDALTARTDEAKLLFNTDGLGNQTDPNLDPGEYSNDGVIYADVMEILK